MGDPEFDEIPLNEGVYRIYTPTTLVENDERVFWLASRTLARITGRYTTCGRDIRRYGSTVTDIRWPEPCIRSYTVPKVENV
jgi:hypothetical protein